MAQSIPLELPNYDPHAESENRLQNAPADHAEALLSLYTLLEALHKRGVFEILSGALGSSDKIVEIVVETVKTPDFIRGIRNGMVLAKILGSIEPELLEALAQALPEAIALTKQHHSKPLGVFGMVELLGNKDTRRVLALGSAVLESFGKYLSREKTDQNQPPA